MLTAKRLGVQAVGVPSWRGTLEPFSVFSTYAFTERNNYYMEKTDPVCTEKRGCAYSKEGTV